MRITYLIAVGMLCCFYTLQGQKLVLGGSAGPTLPHIANVLTQDGREVEQLGRVGNEGGLFGFHAGVFGDYYLSRRFILRGEAGYELLRFQSDNIAFDIGKIHHLKGGLLIGFRPGKRWGLGLGIEGVNRRSTHNGRARNLLPELNGADVKGFYWQGILASDILLGNDIELSFRMTIPRIASLTLSFADNDLFSGRLIVEQLPAFQISVRAPIIVIE